ncbi:hypothetical protein [Lutibacter sp. HS1-25]|uniref:hypothetical protein n=1 Tax=Lutibacter sp. HS1-25 TaxID=2485000 RepID=UPI0013E970C1|nr:hypothetical protein [Lutibacter sp. HS1-25]
MKPLKINQQEPHLKVIKNSSNTDKNVLIKRIFINTLTPDFSYNNSNKEVISPLNHVLL